MGQAGFFPAEPSRVLLSDITFSFSAYVTQCVQQSSVWRFKSCSYFFMMSEARWTAVENVVFFSKRIIVIKFASNHGLKTITMYNNK